MIEPPTKSEMLTGRAFVTLLKNGLDISRIAAISGMNQAEVERLIALARSTGVSEPEERL